MQQAASPTVYADYFMLTAAIEGKEGRDTATTDIKGAHLHAEQDNFMVVKFIDEQVNMMCLIDGGYEDCVGVEGSVKVLYLVLNKALCGIAKVVVSWCNLLTDALVECGFKLNSCDLFAPNAVVKGEQ